MGVATGVAIAGVVVAGVSAGASFASAAKQRKLQKQAQKDAQRALAEAKAKLNVNYYDVLGIQKEPYELQREAMLAQGAQAIEAAQEGERGAAVTAGRVQMAQNEAQAAIRTAMGQEMTELAKLKAGENARLAGLQAAVGLEEVRGAQLAAADAQRAAAQYTQQGFQGLQSMGQQMIQAAPLYSKTKEPSMTPTNEIPQYVAAPQNPTPQQQASDFNKMILGQGSYTFNPFTVTSNPYTQ